MVSQSKWSKLQNLSLSLQAGEVHHPCNPAVAAHLEDPEGPGDPRVVWGAHHPEVRLNNLAYSFRMNLPFWKVNAIT